MDDIDLDKNFYNIYIKFKLQFYRNIFKSFSEREASLTVIEQFITEAIYSLDKPTIKELSDFLNISQPNMAYKISNLVRKGYIEKVRSDKDKREYYLKVTEKFLRYYRISYKYVETVFNRIQNKFSDKQLYELNDILTIINNELMPEITNELNRKLKV